jgi:hypothetical protein
MVIRLTIHFTIRKIKHRKKELNALVPALLNPFTPPTPRILPHPQMQRLALSILNSIHLKPMQMVGMSAPSLRNLISLTLRIRKMGKSSMLPGIIWILILRSRASFTRMLK